MENTISQKELYSQLSRVGKEVMAGKTYTVIWHSKPAYMIIPMKNSVSIKPKYTMKDLPKFTVKGKPPKNLSQSYKKYLYLPE